MQFAVLRRFSHCPSLLLNYCIRCILYRIISVNIGLHIDIRYLYLENSEFAGSDVKQKTTTKTTHTHFTFNVLVLKFCKRCSVDMGFLFPSLDGMMVGVNSFVVADSGMVLMSSVLLLLSLIMPVDVLFLLRICLRM